MNWLETLLTPALVRAVGYTILHSLWQGAVVALALAGLMLVLRRHSAQVRYRVTAAALGLVLLLALVTFVRYYSTALPITSVVAAAAPTVLPTAAELTGAAVSPALAPEGPLSKATVLRYVEHNLPLLVTVWLLGLLTMTLRLLGGLAYVQRLRHYGTRPLGMLWQTRLNNLAERAGLDKPVQLLESSLVRVPVVVGHLKPLILLPLGAVAGLAPAQLEAILAHEIAHVVRRDYLINLLQSVAEILLFYHPAVWFLTATLRSERENCCDDVAASLCGDPLVLARALAALAELGLERTAAPRLSMAATGPRGSLLGRVRRLVQGRTAPTFTEGFMAACVVMVGLLLLSFTAAAALANPRLAEAPRLLRNTVLRPFIKEVIVPMEECVDVPEAWEVPTQPERMVQASTTTTSSTTTTTTSDDDDPKRKNKRKGSSQVVVVDGAGRRGEPGTVIIEKDKKGRVTDMYVNGQRVEGAAADGGKDKGNRTQVIRVPSNGPTYTYVGPGDYKFNYNFDQKFNSAEFQQQMKKLQLDLRQLEKLNKLNNLNYSFSYGGNDWMQVQREALASAEKSLTKARFDRDLSEEEREKIEEALDNIRDQRSEMREHVREQAEAQREHAEAMREAQRDREAAQRDREAAQRDREAAERDAENVRRDELRAERDRARAERDRVRAERDARIRAAEEAMIDAMVKDGVIKDRNAFQLVMTARELTVDGQKQSDAAAAKYRKLYEDGTGRTIGEAGKITMTHHGNSINHIISGNFSSDSWMAPEPPLPPAPPAAPASPRSWRAVPPVPPVAPRAPRAPRAPLAPRTTTVNGVNLTDQLRQDGLIGESDRSYQFRLNGSEMVVNGKKQSAETAAKYRKLMGGAKGEKVNMNITITAD